MKMTAEEKDNLNQLSKYENYEWFVDVAKLISGDSCGELALMYDEQRNATIKCVTKCYFATLCKHSFNQVLSRIELKQQNKKIDFLS